MLNAVDTQTFASLGFGKKKLQDEILFLRFWIKKYKGLALNARKTASHVDLAKAMDS